MNKVLYNDRERDRRGQISNFEDLPIEVKGNFKKVKESIEKYFNKEMDVRVIGSHLEGYYDEFSDYDVVIEEECNIIELEEIVSTECQLNVNVVFDTIKYSKSIIN
jgi:predicted nucleotidyltransferase